MSLISHKTSLFSLPEYFVYLLCLPVFPVSVIDKPLCLICVYYNLLLGSIINSMARKPVVGKFELRMSRQLLHVYHLYRHASFVSFYVNHTGKYICQAAHMLRLVRTYYVRIFPRKGLSTWCKTNLFFFSSRKIFQTKEMHSVALIRLHVKNWPQRSKRFNQLFKSKIKPLTARADRLPY